MEIALEQLGTIRELANRPLDFARSAGFPKKTDLVDLAEAALRIHQKAIEAKKSWW